MFEGKKTTHDFLSLYDDSRPLSQGFNLKTHDFLKPLEKADEAGVVTVATSAEGRAGVAHVLPGGIGTYSISRACRSGSAAAVKPEPDSGRGGHGSYAGAGFTLWEGKDIGNGSGAQWPSPLAASTSTSFASHSSFRNHLSRDKKRIMESGSRSSRGFDEEDEDDDEFCKREGELSVKVDGKSGNEQRGPTTPRSKHSATEQRRRSKINDRFQILRELIPHSDQKRDKASFLLEVIEYIQFLQERVQKYESSYPGFTEENAKLMPWVKVYFRSFWKNARNTNQVPADVAADPSQVIRNVPSPGFIYSADDNNVPPVPGVLSTAQNPIDSDTSAGVSYKSLENHVGFASKAIVASFPPQRLISHIDNLASHSQSQWLRPSDYSVSSDVISEPEELTVDEGTINVSAAYSQNILNTLNQALESSGIDLSQASISVQINLGKRATRRATTTMSSAKDFDDPSAGNRPVIEHSRAGSSGEELEQAPKRHKSENI